MRTHGTSSLVVLWALVGVVPAVAQSFDIEEVAPGIFAALPHPGVPAGANAAFIINDDHVVVVDTHMRPSFARELVHEIRTRTNLPVRFVVNTHWHPDHTQGNQAHVGGYPNGVIFVSHQATREDMMTLGARRLSNDRERLPGEIAALRAALPDLSGEEAAGARQRIDDLAAFLDELRTVELIFPTVTFERSLTLHGPDRRMQILFLGRGHTRGDAVVYLPRQRVAIVGDLVTGGPPFARDGYPSQWVETLARLGKLDIEVVVPGHGRVRRGKQVIADRRRFLEAALRVIRRGAAQHESVANIAGQIDLGSFRDTFDPEPPDRPWRGWMQVLVERALSERQ